MKELELQRPHALFFLVEVFLFGKERGRYCSAKLYYDPRTTEWRNEEI